MKHEIDFAIKVDRSNCYLLDGVIEQYDLKWPVNMGKNLEELQVMNNYLVINMDTGKLSWTTGDSPSYKLVKLTVMELIEKLENRKTSITLTNLTYTQARKITKYYESLK